MMKARFLLLFSAFNILIATTISAQSAAEISAAKSMARSYGYSDSEINAVMNHNISQTSSVAKSVSTPVVVNSTSSTVVPIGVGDEVVEEIVPVEEEEKTSNIYGHDYFTSKGLSIIPSYNAPAPASYVLGPGDEVIIDLWGATVSHIIATLGNDGAINVDNLGPVYLNGLNVKNAEKLLRSELGRIFSGLREDGTGDTFMRLSVGKIKGVGISILGEVVTPGMYTIPSLSSITSAIFMAGGVRETGSVRNINLYRNGKKVSTFDLYDFIFKGKFNENLRLQDNDLLTVDAYDNIITIEGAVVRPMRYELKKGQTVQELLDYARGFSTHADRSKVHVVRRNTSTTGQAYDVPSGQFGSFKLEDGDVVTVRSNPDLYDNRVSISGPVMYPGSYAISSSLKDVASLIRTAGGLREGAYELRGQITRLDEKRLPVFISFDLQKVLKGEEYIELVREDQVKLFAEEEFIQDFSVSIEGHVMEPGTFKFSEGMTVADVILLARGLREDVLTDRGQISRRDHNGVPVIISFNVTDALEGRDNIKLMRGDNIRIYSLRELQDDASVTIHGMVQDPGTFTYREGLTLEDVILMARGFSNGADKTNVQISSRGGRERGTVEKYNLEENPEIIHMALKPYDIISVRRLTYFRPQTHVTIEGEVMSPGTYIIDKSEVRLSDVFADCGGFTDEAWIKGARLTRVLTSEEVQRQRLAVMIANQNLEGNDTIDLNALTDRYYIGIDLKKALDKPGSTADVVLRAGDIVTVPQMNNTVKVAGAVFYPNTVNFDKTLSWRDYIRQAGGFSHNARPRKTYAIYMNGKVAVRRFGRIPMEPGVEIVVPEKEEIETNRVSVSEIASIATSTSSLAYMIVALTNMLTKN